MRILCTTCLILELITFWTFFINYFNWIFNNFCLFIYLKSAVFKATHTPTVVESSARNRGCAFKVAHLGGLLYDWWVTKRDLRDLARSAKASNWLHGLYIYIHSLLCYHPTTLPKSPSQYINPPCISAVACCVAVYSIVPMLLPCESI